MAGSKLRVAGMAAKAVLTCATRRIPIVGEAMEVTEAFRAAYDADVNNRRLDALEQATANVSGFEQSLRQCVREEVQKITDALRMPGLSGGEVAKLIREFNAMKEHQYFPAFFQGMLEVSNRYQEFVRNPGDFGDVKNDHEKLRKDRLHIFIDADKTRIVEIPPHILAYLLDGVPAGASPARMVSGESIWALPTEPAAKPVSSHRIETPEPRRVIVPGGLTPQPSRTHANTLGMEFVRIEPGEFIMGTPPTEKGHFDFDNETPHKVKLTKHFMMGVHQVTRGQFAAFVEAENYKTGAEKIGCDSWRKVGFTHLSSTSVGTTASHSRHG